jgi:hypothetical protein
MPSANARWYKVGDALLVLSQGDITAWSGDALVNAGAASEGGVVGAVLGWLGRLGGLSAAAGVGDRWHALCTHQQRLS